MSSQDTGYWAAHVNGAEEDLLTWERELQRPFGVWLEPWGQKEQSQRLLRSSSFAAIDTAREVHREALKIVEVLNGVFRLRTEAGPIVVSGIWKLSPEGKRDVTMFADAGSIIVSGSAVGRRAGVDDSNGPSDVQKWAELAAKDERLAAMLQYYSTEPMSYVDLYRAYEVVDRYWQGRLHKQCWSPSANQLERFKRTANYYHRHSVDPRLKPPSKPMPLAEAAVLVRTVICETLREAAG